MLPTAQSLSFMTLMPKDRKLITFWQPKDCNNLLYPLLCTTYQYNHRRLETADLEQNPRHRKVRGEKQHKVDKGQKQSHRNSVSKPKKQGGSRECNRTKGKTWVS